MIYGLYHSGGETVGLIGDVINGLNLPFKAIHLYKGEALPSADIDGLIVMGGPMNVDETDKYSFLQPELELIQKTISEKKPVLGICLGAQLIAKALGQKIFQNPVKEVGWHPIQMTHQAAIDPLFKSFPHELTVLHWHGDTFNLPTGALHLAKTLRCANQAFRHGTNVYGLQFHFEVTPAMAAEWSAAASEQSFIKAAGETPEKIVAASPAAFTALEPHAKKFFSSYLKTAYAVHA